MIITGHQPNYLPYPGFFHKALRAEAFVFVDTVQFVKRGTFGWIHRNRIRTASDKGWDWLTVPVLTRGKYTQSIRDTRINNAGSLSTGSRPELVEGWRKKHLRTIEWNYRKAPFFEHYYTYFNEIYSRTWELLAELNEEIITFIFSELDIDPPVYRTSEMNVSGKASELIVSFCRELGADAYISGVHGRAYLDAASFEENNIELVFQDFKPVEHPQQFPGGFIPNLSIIDMLMNAGPQAARSMLVHEEAAK